MKSFIKRPQHYFCASHERRIKHVRVGITRRCRSLVYCTMTLWSLVQEHIFRTDLPSSLSRPLHWRCRKQHPTKRPVPLPNDTASHTGRRQRQLCHTDIANSGQSWRMCAFNERCFRGQRLNTGTIIIGKLVLRNNEQISVNRTINSWNQLHAGLLASFPCELNRFRERVKNVVTGKGITVWSECK